MKRCYCASCVHMHEVKNYGDKWTCDAFPGGIPKAIYMTGMKHSEPYPGDNGIRFERDTSLDNMTEKEFYE